MEQKKGDFLERNKLSTDSRIENKWVDYYEREYKNPLKSQMWWYIAVIPALKRLRQEEHKLEASLGYLKITKICPQRTFLNRHIIA